MLLRFLTNLLGGVLGHRMDPIGQQPFVIRAVQQGPLVLSTLNRRVAMARTLYEGDTIPIMVTVVDPQGQAVDLTGATVTLRIGPRPGALAQVTKKMYVTDPLNGVAEVTLVPTETTGLYGTQHYEVTCQRLGGTEEVVAAGSLTFHDTVRGG